ncbi:MAG: TonB-dependent receptor [Vicinamibacterales bacterium]
MRIAFVVLLASTLAVPVAAQSRSIHGTVHDQTGAALPGVTVTVRRETGEPVGATVSGTDGRYDIPLDSGGVFQVTFELPLFSTVVTEVRVRDGESADVPATLRVTLSSDVVVRDTRRFGHLETAADADGGLIGVSDAASEGLVAGRVLAQRPRLRAADVLEAVPGLSVSQHSGEGKANQYYLRGFNLDHGTDFATTVAGVPVNLPTHAHGHGYTDLNFLIPELVTGVYYRKGPYYADEGDFSAAGAAHIRYATALDAPLVELSAGEGGWRRVLAAASPKVGPGHLLVAGEFGANDGPWTRGDDLRRLNAVVRYSTGSPRDSWSATLMAYGSDWRATDQVPRRALESGALSRWGRRSHHRRTHAPHQPVVGLAADARWHVDTGLGVCARLRARPLLELHLLPRRPRQCAIRSSRPIAAW